jgi:2,3-bisphosphoglycerate-independent phosphoglycerate mutase
VDDAIEDGSLAQNPTLLETIASAKARNRPLHLIGLVSDGGVHSHVSHLCALIKICNDNQVKPVIHAITDGRDTSPKSAKKYLQQMVDALEEFGGSVATVSGRYYAMDRDNRWDRTQIAWEAMVNGKGESASDVLQAIDDAYANGENDEFVIPRVMPNAEKIEADDAVLFFNFRNDRPRQMTAALSMPDFDGFDRGDYSPVVVTTMTEYEKKFNAPVIFPPERPATNLADTISQAGLKQLHCSETEKYAHVTFFLNGGKEQPYEGEDRILIESPKVNTYDECPEMSAKEVADEIIKAANAGEHDFIVVNFANGDMVGHTAIPEPIIRAVEALDREVGRVLDAAVANDYSVIVTADHGNCDEYIDPYSGEPNTQHTVYPVPCLVIDKSFWKLSTGAGLSNIAPTVMQLMGIEQPKEIMSKSILLEEMTEDSKPAAY